MKPNDIDTWRMFSAKGSSAKLVSGAAVTDSVGADCPPYWFSGETTVILGATPDTAELKQVESVASWGIHVDAAGLTHFRQGFLVIACIRHFGGLHSFNYNARADIYLNGHQIDGFALRIKPPEHSDYFHRIPVPPLPPVPLISACQTIYAWPLRKDLLTKADKQDVKVRIDAGVRWDIDLLALLLQTRSTVPRVFLSYSWNDKDIASRLIATLGDFDVDVWFDEANIGIGDLPGEQTKKAIEEVQYVVVLLSKQSLKSKWVIQEIELALLHEAKTNRLKILPVILDDCEIPNSLSGRIYGDLRSTDNYQKVATMIRSRLESQL